jgi:hypothetical protein
MPDSDQDPILFDMAAEEVQQNENKAEIDIQNALRQQQMEENKKNIDELQSKM